MSGYPLKSRVEEFLRVIRQSDVTRRRVESEFRKGTLVRRDVEIVYEGLFLRAVVAFEDFLESVFFLTLTGKSSRLAWRSILGGRATDLCACVMGDKKYLDWLPYDRTLSRANLYLRSGRPFTLLKDDDKGKLTQIVTIRHAIAHSSDSAYAKFKKDVIGSTHLPPDERRPAGYLRGFASLGTTRYQLYAQSLGGMALRFSDGTS